MGDVRDGHRLGAILLADPVSVRKVDSDRGCRVASAAEAGNVDNLGRNALHALLLEAGIDRCVILEPLCVGAEEFCTRRCGRVLDVND